MMPRQTPPEVTEVVGVGTLAEALVVLVGAYILARVLALVLGGAAERSPSRRITIKMFVPVVKLTVYGAAVFVVVVPVLELTAAQLLAVSGLIGAAVGFGLRDLVASVVGGLVLVTEKPYQVGDKVTIADQYGEVVDIGLRSTTLETPDDTAVVVPNDTLFTDDVANANGGDPQMLVTVDLAVTPEADIDAALGILEDALVTSPHVHVSDDHPVSVRVADQVSYCRVRGRAYVADLRDEQAFASDVTRRALAAFEKEGIETPDAPQLHAR